MSDAREAWNAQLDELYQRPLAEFVAARDALARQLRAQGKADEARQVARLRRPAAAAWAIDRVARARPDEVRALIAADDRLRAAQGQGAPPAELRAAMQDHRERVRRLAALAAEELPARGRQGQGRAIQATLQAAAAGGPELRDQLRRGALTGELEAPGFDALGGLGLMSAPARPMEAARPQPDQPAPPAPPGGKRAAAQEEREAARLRKAEQARARQEARQREALARQVATLEREASKLEERASELTAEAESLASRAEKAGEAAEAARREAAQARANAGSARNKQS